MPKADYKAFIADYQFMYYAKKSSLWQSAKSYKNSFFLLVNYFSRLSDKYNYIEYKAMILNDKSLHQIIQNILKENSLNCLTNADLIFLHYCCETYIAFLIEHIIKQELEAQRNIKAYSTIYLDTRKKVDFIANYKHYQIKNISFLTYKGLYGLLEKYKKESESLYFIFYELGENNIEFVSVGGLLTIPIKSIDSFTINNNKTENKSLKELISSL